MLTSIELLEQRTLFAAAPDTVVGYTFDMTITGASGAFAPTGTYELVLAKSGNSYVIHGDGSQVLDSSGTYSYSRDSVNSGKFIFDDSLIGGGVGIAIFDTSTTGSFALSSSSFSGSQTATFSITDQPVPDFASLSGNTLTITGTAADDNTVLSVKSGVLGVTQDGHTQTFQSSLIQHVTANLNDGNDSFSAAGLGAPIYVLGGAGNDTIAGGDGNDTLTGSAGRNVLSGNAGNDRLNGGNSADTLIGLTGNDRLFGSAGDDSLDGGDQPDHLYGGDDNDIISGGSSNDYLYGENGNDTLSGGNQDDIIDGGANVDRIYGNNGNDTMYGGGGNDRLEGGIGVDSFRGGSGNDSLFARDDGSDVLKGDGGSDSAQFDSLDVRRQSIEIQIL